MEYLFLAVYSFVLLLLYIFFWFKLDIDWKVDEGEVKGNEIDMFHKANEKLEELIKRDTR